MGKKNLKVVFDSPVALALVACCLAVFVVCCIAPQAISNRILAFFATPVIKQNGKVINFFNISTYLKLVVHIFGHSNFYNLVLNLCIILMLAPQTEKLYGSRFFALMVLIASLVNGVLAFCFVSFSLNGAQSISFLLIVLNVFISIKKQEMPISPLILTVFFIVYSIAAGYGSYAQITSLAGGLCAGLFGIIPQEKQKSKNPKKSSIKITTETNNE